MRLYYTVPSVAEAAQPTPSMSLGGFKSSTPLQNAQFGNMFDGITAVTINNFNQNQYVGLVLKNETGADITNAKLWFVFPTGCYSKLKVAAVDMVAGSNGDLQMEQIMNIFSKPINGDFYEADVDNKVDLGDLTDGEQIGIWIERSLLLDVITAQSENIYEPDTALENRFKEVVLNKVDDIGLFVSWD